MNYRNSFSFLSIFFLLCIFSFAEQSPQESIKFQLFGTKSSFSINGYLQINYSYYSDKIINNEFKIRRARLDFRGDTENIFKWRIQVDAVQTIKDLNLPENQTQKVVIRPVLLDANIDLLFKKYFMLRIGQFKIPFSTENLQSSNDLDLINRAQLVEKIVPGRDIGSQGRDIGIISITDLKITEDRKIKFFIGLFNGAGINVGDDNKNKDLAYRFEIKPLKGLFLALSQYYGKSGINKIDRNKIGLDFSFDIKNISFKGEYGYAKDDNIKRQGWYFQTKYKLNSTIDIICRFDSYDQNTSISGDKTDILIIGINYYPIKRVKIQLNYQRNMYEVKNKDSNTILSQFQINF